MTERRLNRVFATAAGLALAAAGTGLALEAKSVRADEPASSPAPSAEPRASQAITNFASPEASATPEVEIQYIEVPQLVPHEVQPGDFIPGDVSMSDTEDSALFPLYDQDTNKAPDVEDNTRTALYVDVQAPGVVLAPYGKITIIRGMNPEQKAEFLRNETTAKTRAGFEKSGVVLWTGYDTTVDQAGYKADGTQGNVDTSGTPVAEDNLSGLDNQAKIRTILNLFADGTIDPNSEEGKVLMGILVNCLCACETPAQPKPTPKPEKPKEVCVTTFRDRLYNPNKGPVTVRTRGLVVRGDVLINGKRYYDEGNSSTAAIDRVWTEKPRTYKVSGPYEADVLWMEDCASKAQWKDQVDLAIEQVRESGRKLDPRSLK